jgi:hypothetical protein
MVAMPDDTTDGLIVGRLSTLGALLRLINEEGDL